MEYDLSGKIYKNRQGEEFVVLDYIGNYKYNIRFLESGNEYIRTYYDIIGKRNILDKKKIEEKENELINKKFINKLGLEYEVIERVGGNKFKVKFLESGFENIMPRYRIVKGEVPDLYYNEYESQKYVGNLYINNGQKLEFKVIEYNKDTCKYKVKFLETGYETEVEKSRLLNRCIRDMIAKEEYDKSFIGKTFKNLSGLEYKVIEQINGQYYKIRFIESGYETVNTRSCIEKGLIKDKLEQEYRKMSLIGKIFKNNLQNAEFEVIKYVGSDRHGYIYLVKFLKTGYMTNVHNIDIIQGRITDPLYPSSNGCIIGFPDTKEAVSSTREYDIWRNMIDRCYNKNNKNYIWYGANGVIVSERWHRFDLFYHDIKYIDGYDEVLFNEGKLHLDKDLKQIGCSRKIYSLETCTFLPANVNLDIAMNPSKYYGIYEPIYFVPAVISQHIIPATIIKRR